MITCWIGLPADVLVASRVALAAGVALAVGRRDAVELAVPVAVGLAVPVAVGGIGVAVLCAVGDGSTRAPHAVSRARPDSFKNFRRDKFILKV